MGGNVSFWLEASRLSMGSLVNQSFEFDRIVAPSPVTNAVLNNCVDLAQSQGKLNEIEVLRNVGTRSLMRSLERMDVQIFVDDPLLLINDLYKIDLLRQDFDEQLFVENLRWISNRLMSKQEMNSTISSTTWVFDYPERHLSKYVGTALPLDRQYRSRQISALIESLVQNQSLSNDSLDDAISVLLMYGLDDGWKKMPIELLHETESYFVELNSHFPQHEEFREKAFQINDQKPTNLEMSSERTVLIEGAIEMLKVLSLTSNGNTQSFASYYKNMLNLTLETSTKLLDEAASSSAFKFRVEKELAEIPMLKNQIKKKNDEIITKNLLLESLIKRRRSSYGGQ